MLPVAGVSAGRPRRLDGCGRGRVYDVPYLVEHRRAVGVGGGKVLDGTSRAERRCAAIVETVETCYPGHVPAVVGGVTAAVVFFDAFGHVLRGESLEAGVDGSPDDVPQDDDQLYDEFFRVSLASQRQNRWQGGEAQDEDH